MRSVLLAIPPKLAADLQGELVFWNSDRAAEQWFYRLWLTSATTGPALKAELASQPPYDHAFLVGDLPSMMPTWSPDGHPDRPVPIDSQLVPAGVAVGRLRYEGIDGIVPLTEYKKYFQRRHAYTVTGCSGYPLTAHFADHLDYYGYDEMGKRVAAEFAAMGSAFTHVGPHMTPGYPAPNTNDGELAAHRPNLFFGEFSGGDWQGDGSGPGPKLFDVGTYQAFLRSIKAIFAFTYASYAGDEDWPNNIPRAILVSDDVLVSVLNWEGRFRWSTFLAGSTIGQAAVDSYNVSGMIWQPSYLLGDPTIMLDAGTIQAVDFQAQIDVIRARLSVLEGNVPVIIPMPPAGIVSNGSFDAPHLALGTFQYSPAVPGWTFAGAALVSIQSTDWKVPTGSRSPQVAAIQGHGSISQTIDGLVAGQAKTISLSSAQRPAPYGGQTLEIRIDGVKIATIVPGGSWGIGTALSFVPTAASHLLAIVGGGAGDCTAFVTGFSVA